MLKSQDIEGMLSSFREVSGNRAEMARRLRSHAAFNAVRVTNDDIKSAANFLRLETRRFGNAIPIKVALKIVSVCHGYSGWDDARVSISEREAGWSIEKPIGVMIRPGLTIISGGSGEDRSVLCRLIEISASLSGSSDDCSVVVIDDIAEFHDDGSSRFVLFSDDAPCRDDADRVTILGPGRLSVSRSGERTFRVCFFDPREAQAHLASSFRPMDEAEIAACFSFLSDRRGMVLVSGPKGAALTSMASTLSAAWRTFGVHHGIIPVRDPSSAATLVSASLSGAVIGIIRADGTDPRVALCEISGMEVEPPIMSIAMAVDGSVSVSIDS